MVRDNITFIDWQPSCFNSVADVM